MKTIFDKSTRDEVIRRVGTIDNSCQAEWGKMTPYQMVRHCAKFDELMLGKKKYKQSFLGKLFGKMALKGNLKDDSPMKRNLPTVPGFKINESGDAGAEAKKWSGLIQEYGTRKIDSVIHPFFGSMMKDQIGQLVYKHVDHHLRQFGK